METKKTKIIALSLNIGGGIAIIVSMAAVFSLSLIVRYPFPPFALFGIAIGIFNFIVSRALHKVKKWAYFVAFAQFGLGTIFSLIASATGNFFAIISLLISVGLIILLYLDKNTFLGTPSQSKS